MYCRDHDTGKEFRIALDQWKKEHPFPNGSVHTVVDHIVHIAKVAGVDHVGLGSDFDGITRVPLTYSPAVKDASELSFEREEKADAPDLVTCWKQKEPAQYRLPLRAPVQ